MENFEEDHAGNFVRVDNRTKISIMAALLCTGNTHEAKKEAVEIAFDLDRMVGDELRRLKRLRTNGKVSMGGIRE